MRTVRGRSAAGLLAVTLALAGMAASSAPAGAAVQVVVDATVLRVYLSGAAGESVTVQCAAGSAQVNATTTALACGSATSIQVNGSDGPDTIDLSAIGAAEFSKVTQVSATGGAGADTITAAGIDTNMFGDAGNDVLNGGPGDDYFQSYGGKDTLLGNAGDDVIFSDTGSTIDAGPDDDIIYSIWPAGRPASLAGGSGIDDFRHSASQLEDKLFVQPRLDGGLDLVDTMPTASDVITVPASFETLSLSTVLGNDLVWINGLSPTIEVKVAGGAGTPRLEVMGKGAVSKTPTQVTRSGFAPVTYSGMAEVLAYGALASGNHSFVHAAGHDLGLVHLTTPQFSATAAKIAAGTLSRAGYAGQLVGGLTWRQAEAERIFQAYLRRGLDSSGRDYYAEQIRTGTKLNTIRATVLGSSEYFKNRAGSSTSLFIDAVYTDVLHRLPDAGGKAYWLGRLSSGVPRRTLAASILGLDEPVKEFIRYHYRDLLGRDPSAGELSTWRDAVRDQATGERDLQVSLVASSAYFNRHL